MPLSSKCSSAGVRQQAIAAAESTYAAGQTAADQTFVDARGAATETYAHDRADRVKQQVETNAGLQATYDKHSASTRADKFTDLATSTPTHFAALFSGIATAASDFVDSTADTLADLKTDFAEHTRVYSQSEATDDKITSSSLTTAANTFTTTVVGATVTGANTVASLLNDLATAGAHLPFLPSVATAPTVIIPEITQVTIDHFDDYTAPTSSATYDRTFDDLLAEHNDWTSLVDGSHTQLDSATTSRLTDDRLDTGLTRDQVKPDESLASSSILAAVSTAVQSASEPLIGVGKAIIEQLQTSFVDSFKQFKDKGSEIAGDNSFGQTGEPGIYFVSAPSPVAIPWEVFIRMPKNGTNGTWVQSDGETPIPDSELYNGKPKSGSGWWDSKKRGAKTVEYAGRTVDYGTAVVRSTTTGDRIVLEIPVQGTRGKDNAKAAKLAAEKFGTLPDPKTTRWHHKSFDREASTFVMELVEEPTHTSATHRGAYAQFLDWVGDMLKSGKYQTLPAEKGALIVVAVHDKTNRNKSLKGILAKEGAEITEKRSADAVEYTIKKGGNEYTIKKGGKEFPTKLVFKKVAGGTLGLLVKKGVPLISAFFVVYAAGEAYAKEHTVVAAGEGALREVFEADLVETIYKLSADTIEATVTKDGDLNVRPHEGAMDRMNRAGIKDLDLPELRSESSRTRRKSFDEIADKSDGAILRQLRKIWNDIFD